MSQRPAAVVTVLFAAAVAAGTVLAGWWTVPALAFVRVRIVPRGARPVRSCVAGAVLGWGSLLGWTGFRGPAGLLARRAGGALGLPGWSFFAVTLLFAAVLAGTAARLARPGSPR